MGETAGGVLRRGADRIVAGVCSGLGHYFHVDPLLVRIVFVVLALANGIGIVLYLALWLLMDPPAGTPTSTAHSWGARVRMMGQELREDFRSGFAPGPRPGGADAAASGSGAPASGPSWESRLGNRPRGFWFGVILIIIGAYLLLDHAGVFNWLRWEILGPIVLIVLGVLLLVRRR